MGSRKEMSSCRIEIEDGILIVGDLFEKIEEYKRSEEYKQNKRKENDLNKKLKNFLKKYTKQKILTLSLDEYCEGEKNVNSFCNLVENELMFGEMSGSTNAYQKFVIYRKRNEISGEMEYVFGDHRTKKRKGFGSTVDQIFENVKKEIVNVIKYMEKQDYDAFEKCPLNPMFKNKLAFLYNHNTQMPIYGDKDLNNILDLFHITYDKGCDRFYKRALLFDFYQKAKIQESLSPYMFMTFLYSCYGYRERIKLTKQKVDALSYTLEDVKYSKLPDKSCSTGRTSPRIIAQDSYSTKLTVGKMGETIVYEYLIAHQSELGIKNIRSYCMDNSDRDDMIGYDFSYESNGQTVYIEVKSTKQNYGDRVCFEMSKHEFEVMKKNQSSYYIYFINNIYNNKVIKRIKATEIVGSDSANPSHYRIEFDGISGCANPE